jgi:hypothetical protein
MIDITVLHQTEFSITLSYRAFFHELYATSPAPQSTAGHRFSRTSITRLLTKPRRGRATQMAYELLQERLLEWRYQNALLRDRRHTRELQNQLRPKGKAFRKARRQYAEHVFKTAGTFDAFLEAKRVLTAQCADRFELQRLTTAANDARSNERRAAWRRALDRIATALFAKKT